MKITPGVLANAAKTPGIFFVSTNKRGRPKISENAFCHIDKPYFAKGLCKTCYRSNLKKEKIKTMGEIELIVYQFNRHSRGASITPQEYAEIYAKSDGLCGICGNSENIVIDHDHETGKVRGLLCVHCNWALGHFRDSIENLEKAQTYLSGGGDK